MICALYRERQERLPETPAELCEALVQMLLHRRERETPGLQDAHFPAAWRALQYPQKKGLLADLAWHMVSKEESSIDLESAKVIVGEVMASTPGRTRDEASEVLQALVERSGLLRPAGDDRIDFLHNTLKEYLAAGRIVEGGHWEPLTEQADDPTWQPIILFTLALAPEPFSSGLVRRLFTQTPEVPKQIIRNPSILSKTERIALAETKARDFFLVRCRGAAKRLAADLSATIDNLMESLFPPSYMPEVEALAQLGPRILVHEAASLMQPFWWANQDCRTIVRCLRLLRLIGGPRAATAVASIASLPSNSAQVTGEWMMASSELCDASLTWPFREKEQASARGTHVSDLRAVAGLTSLTFLQLNNTRVSDLRHLTGLTSLKSLGLNDTVVNDLSPLAGLISLKSLYLNNTLVKDLGPLTQLSALQYLCLNWTRITDVSPLAGLSSLNNLHLNNVQLSDVSPLAGLASLKMLLLDGTKVSDLSPLRELPLLERLDLDGTPVSDLRGLRKLNSLEILYLQSTRVRDLSPLASLKSLGSLFLNRTPVTDLSPLVGLTSLYNLYLSDTDVSDLKPLAKQLSIRVLFLDRTKVSDLSPLTKIESLQALSLKETKVPKEELEQFRREKPNVTITT